MTMTLFHLHFYNCLTSYRKSQFHYADKGRMLKKKEKKEKKMQTQTCVHKKAVVIYRFVLFLKKISNNKHLSI